MRSIQLHLVSCLLLAIPSVLDFANADSLGKTSQVIVCNVEPCLTPSQQQSEALFNAIEGLFPTIFFTPTATQNQVIAGELAYYRSYAKTAGLATYQGALWYTLNGNWQRYASLDESNRQFCNGRCWHTIPISESETAFHGNIVLGTPTLNSVKANIFSVDQSGTIYLEYGTHSGTYPQQTPTSELLAGKSLEFALQGLAENTLYYYRLHFKSSDAASAGFTAEYQFHTARPSGSTFTFGIQGDSHPERVKTQFNAELYQRTLRTVAADYPDFYILMGDDFSVDTLNPKNINPAQVSERYTLQRPYLGLVGASSPIFLVNGNHEQAARYLLDGTPNNVAVWAQNARNSFYSQPASDGFYTGNLEQVPFIGLLRNYYAWTWGDALFVVIDPYWGSPTCVDAPFGGDSKRTNLWDVTHGDDQYNWLKTTLEQSQAKYKFVFAHHVMGTGRGGIELAKKYEWGGLNNNGSWGFSSNRPNWIAPIHQLLVDNHVTIFFQGHDHIWVKQQLDGVIYQTLSEPADPNYSLFNADAYLSGDKFPNTGYTRVTVAPTAVKVDYVRTFLPSDEGAGKVNGSVAFSYSIP